MLGQLDAPIVPGQTLGGIQIGVQVRVLADDLLRADLRGEVAVRMAGLFEANYILGNGAIEVAVDVRNGRIARVTGSTGYIGTLEGRIKIGMRAGEAMAIDGRLYYDEPSELILRLDTPGLALEVAEPDPFPESVPSLRISAISVYHPILDTRAGQTGDW